MTAVWEVSFLRIYIPHSPSPCQECKNNEDQLILHTHLLQNAFAVEIKNRGQVFTLYLWLCWVRIILFIIVIVQVKSLTESFEFVALLTLSSVSGITPWYWFLLVMYFVCIWNGWVWVFGEKAIPLKFVQCWIHRAIHVARLVRARHACRCC